MPKTNVVPFPLERVAPPRRFSAYDDEAYEAPTTADILPFLSGSEIAAINEVRREHYAE